MRTTINIDDEVYAVARSIAESTSQSIGKVITDLVRKGLSPTSSVSYRDNLPVFEVRESSPVITIDDVLKDEDGL